MTYLTFTYLVTGRNRSALVNRMRLAGIPLLKMSSAGEKSAKITIYAKDRVKYFAICENLCYNKLIGVGGLFAPVYRLLKAPELIIGVFVFLAVLFVGSNLYLSNEFVGDAEIYRAEADQAFKKAEILPYRFFDKTKLSFAETELKQSDINFVKIEKSGNRAIITIYSAVLPPEKMHSSSTDVIAKEDCSILKITAYSGTLLVAAGDKVMKGQPLIAAYEILNDGSKTPCVVTGYVLAEKAFEFCYSCEFEPDDSIKANAVSAAKFMAGDKVFTRFELAQKGNDLYVTLYYESLLFGNELFGG